jgi:signal recognition particle GTPase
MRLGPLGQIMNMIPGMSGMLGKEGVAAGENNIKLFMTVMVGSECSGDAISCCLFTRARKSHDHYATLFLQDSMCDKELDSDTAVFEATPNRSSRIAKGAGVQRQQVNVVLEMFKPFKGT